MMRDNIEVYLLESDEHVLCGSPIDVIDNLRLALEMVPDEFKSAAVFHAKGDDYGVVSVCLSYMRPKTPEEINEEEKHFRENLSEELERAEATFLYLKRKLQESE